jgi:nucleoside-diphosphate-sugar epimerase
MVDHVEELIVETSTPIREVMQTIDQGAEGIAFVTNGSELAGVVTDGDIRSGILNGVSLSESVEAVMNTNPVVVYESWDSQRRREELTEHDVASKVTSHSSLLVPVLDDADRVVGMEYVSADGTRLGGAEMPVTRSIDTVLVIGGAGYIGSGLSRKLLNAGFNVRVLDKAVYGTQGIDELRENDDFNFLRGDMRSIEDVMDAITGVDAVVHLGALVGDPASGIDTQKTLEMNYHATHTIASICKYHQINRFIFASTCSVYGQSYDEERRLIEDDELNPVSMYAKTKIESEKALLDLADENFSPTIFRMATIYGLSNRMRFDLVVNILSAKAHFEGEIPIFGGDQYRPNVHVRDAAQAYVDCLEAPIEDVGGEVFNVGSNDQNYQISEIGRKVAEVFPEADIDWHRDKEDHRSYQVDFSKIRDVMDYEVKETIVSGAEEIKAALEGGRFQDYTAATYNNYKTLKEDELIFD